MDLLVFRPVMHKDSSITLTDLLESDLETVLKANEFIDIKEAMEYQNYKDSEQK